MTINSFKDGIEGMVRGLEDSIRFYFKPSNFLFPKSLFEYYDANLTQSLYMLSFRKFKYMLAKTEKEKMEQIMVMESIYLRIISLHETLVNETVKLLVKKIKDIVFTELVLIVHAVLKTGMMTLLKQAVGNVELKVYGK